MHRPALPPPRQSSRLHSQRVSLSVKASFVLHHPRQRHLPRILGVAPAQRTKAGAETGRQLGGEHFAWPYSNNSHSDNNLSRVFLFVDGIDLQNDPRYKKYIQLVERNLQSFDNVNEWADVNPFLLKIMRVSTDRTSWTQAGTAAARERRQSQATKILTAFNPSSYLIVLSSISSVYRHST